MGIRKELLQGLHEIGRSADMRNYYITDCISGCTEGAEPIHRIDEARKMRDELNRKRKAEGGSDEFWIIVDSKGRTVK